MQSRRGRYILAVSLLIVFISCNDSYQELSGDYFLRMEGKNLNDILSHTADRKEIPSNVLSYGYNKDFIIASQKPDKTVDPLYSPVFYDHGRDSIYYWIIVHSKRLTVGPMSRNDFETALNTYNVPKDLKLKPLDWQ